MIRSIFALLLLIHGLLHLIGFSREFGYIEPEATKSINELNKKRKLTGVIWLATAVLFIAAAGMFFFRRDGYWMAALVAVLMSQSLIILNWQAARFGTIPNIFVLVGIALSVSALRFDGEAKKEAAALRAEAKHDLFVVTGDMLENVPPVVRKWLERSGVVGKQCPAVIDITQRGEMRTSPEGDWLPFTAKQTFTIDPPGFVWLASIDAGFFTIAGRDKFRHGHGNMLIKPLYIYPLANSTGAEIDQGTLLRYLAEIAWYPQSVLSQYITWEAIDDKSARAIFEFAGTSVSGTFFFNDQGDMEGFQAQRYFESNGKYSMETWSVKARGYTSFEGIRVANRNEVTWKLKEGDFTWLRLEVTAMTAEK